MISYASGPSSAPLLGETIGQCLDRVAARFPDQDALVSIAQDLRFTWAALHALVERTARAFLACGIERGDRVGIWSANRAEWLIVQYAAAKAGAVLVNINPAYRTRELEHALRHSGVSLLVMARRFRATDYVAMMTELAPELASCRPGQLSAAKFPALRAVVYLDSDAEPGGFAWPDFQSAFDVPVSRLREREAALQFDDAVNIQYTSGTTGTPKGATLSHHNVLNNGYFIGELLGYSEHDRICVPVPFYHCFGCVIGSLAALTHGAAMVLPGEAFDAEATLGAVDRERCTSLYGVPTMFIAELQHPSFDAWRLDSLRTGVMAGAPCPIEIMRQVIDRMHMREVGICYGMTETSPVSFQSRADDPLERRVGTVGSVHPHLECKIVDPRSGGIVPRGTPGELCTRGYSVMLGYWNDPGSTSEAIDAARWMHTGDLAVMRDDGYVNIVGRIKDMIVRGGEKVYPREVEEFLYTHPKVRDVQVIGVPDEKYGEEVCAWIRLKDGAAATADDIREFCRGRIASYKIPRFVRFCDDYPMTVTGKVQKYVMREMSVAELGLGRAARIDTA